MKHSIVFFSALMVLAAWQAAAGSIGYTNVSPYMDWEPDCYKPDPPSFFVNDADSYNWAVDEFNSYVSEVQSYVDCIQSEGESDVRTLSRAVANGVDEKRSEALSELQNTKSEFLLQKSLLY
jgi:hypothetical protein